jgi:DNA-binding MarR family transcriptional regulator
MTTRHDDIETLVRAVYGLSALKRDLPRLAGFDHPVGLVPLAVVHRCAPARVRDIAQELHVDVSVASRQIAALVAAGYIRREADPEDGRAQRVSLTAAGETALQRAHERIVGVFADVLAGWNEDEITSLTSALARLRSDYARATSGGAAPTHTKEAA